MILCLWVFLLVSVSWNMWLLLYPHLLFYLSSTRPLLPLPHWWQSPRWWPRQPGSPRSPRLPRLLPPPERGTHWALLPQGVCRRFAPWHRWRWDMKQSPVIALNCWYLIPLLHQPYFIPSPVDCFFFFFSADEITSSFRRFGHLVVDWPHKAESKSYFPPKGIGGSS